MYKNYMERISKQTLLQGKVCFLGSLAQIFYSHQICLEEEIIYGLGFGLGFRLLLNQNDEYVDMDCIDVITDFEKCKKFLNSLNVDISLNCLNTEEEYAQLLEQNVGQPVLADIDSFYLSYGCTFQSSHDAHSVVLTNVDNTNILIQDNYVNRLVPGKQSVMVLKSDILKWCNLLEALPDASFKYVACTFKFDCAEVKLSKEDVIHYIRENRNVSNTEKIAESIYRYEGTIALEKLLELFERYEKRDFNERYTIQKIHERLSAHGGLYQSRKLYSCFIRWYGSTFECGECQETLYRVAYAMEEVADVWRKISSIILKSLLRGKVPDWRGIYIRASKNIVDEKLLISRFEKSLDFDK